MNPSAAEDRTKYDRLRYVAGNYQSLQGLTWVCLGGGLVLLETEGIPGITFPWWLNLLGCGLVFVAVQYVPKFYERRFGSVESRVSPINIKSLALVLALLFALFLWPGIARHGNPVAAKVSSVAHRMISDPGHKVNLWPFLYWFGLLCTWALTRSHFGRLRMVLFAACILLLWTGVLVFLPLREPKVTQQTLWRILNAGWLGVSMVLLGVYNHLTLVHFLPAGGQTVRND
jgi:hypothetical protein